MPDRKSPDYFLPFQEIDEKKLTGDPLSSRIQVDLGAVSNPGKVRITNEDAFLISRTGRFWEKLKTNLDDSILPDRHEENGYTMIVADGVGGLTAGEVASTTALATIVNLVLSSVKWALKLDEPESRDQEIREAINRVLGYLSQADLAISNRAKREGIHRGMGTTLTAAYSYADDLFVFHVGDSRAYLMRNAQLVQLTRDQTVAQDLADAGAIPQSAVPNHHFKHMLTQAVGLQDGEVNAEIHHLKLEDGDVVLLCSDGLSDLVKDAEIQKVLKSGKNSQEKCDSLLKLALSHGGGDNITVLIASYQIP